MKYEIPKEIKARPQILGLEIRELVIILISSILLLTVLREFVHSVFMIPYLAVSGIAIFYFFSPSKWNPDKRIYESIILWFRNRKETFHAIDHHEQQNIAEHERIRSKRGSEIS